MEHAVTILMWPPLDRLPENATAADRINLADYIKDDPKAGNNSDDWGFVFDEKEYPNCERSTQEKLVAHIQSSCGEQGFSLTVHTWANKETRGTLRIRLKCSNNRRTKCKFSFQVCFGIAEGFWYLRRGSGNHIHCGHDLDKPKFSHLGKMKPHSRLEAPPSSFDNVNIGGKRPAPVSGMDIPTSLDVDVQQRPQKQQRGDFLGYGSSFPPAAVSQKPFGLALDPDFQKPEPRQNFHGGGLDEPQPPQSYNTLDQTVAAPSNQEYNSGLSRSRDDWDAVTSMIAVASSAPPNQSPLDDRQVSVETQRRRDTFLANSGRQIDSSGMIGMSSRQPSDATDQAVAPGHIEFQRRKTEPTRNLSSIGELPQESAPPPTTAKSSSLGFMFSSVTSTLTSAIKGELAGFMASTTSLLGGGGEKKGVSDDLKGLMNSTNSLFMPKASSSLENGEKTGNEDGLEDHTAVKEEEEEQGKHSIQTLGEGGGLGDYTAPAQDFTQRPSTIEIPPPTASGIGGYGVPDRSAVPLRSAMKPTGEGERRELPTHLRESTGFGTLGDFTSAPLRSALKTTSAEDRRAAMSMAAPENRKMGGGGGLEDHTVARAPRSQSRGALGGGGGLADHSSGPPRNISFKGGQGGTGGALTDYTAANHRPTTKGNKGASFYSSIDTFALSSETLGESVDDLNKLEGFGGGTPATKKKESPPKEQDP
mmetsp:Transcript_9435/g.19603  ORF Transcript_9435/g.19603 Transcript_9435/m.19603 type:complete len:703 (-) Transcript_9435:105-2213(-)